MRIGAGIAVNFIWPKGSLNVVLVDDDPDVLRSLAFAFEVDGFCVRTYPSAEAMLEAGPPPRTGCLVIDQKLQGADGLSLLERLRKRGCRLPAVLITTPDAALARRAAAAGVPILEKPLLCDTLIGTVRSLVGAAPQDRAHTFH